MALIRPATPEDLPDFAALMEASWEDAPLPYANGPSVVTGYVQAFRDIVIGGAPGICLLAPGKGMLLLRGTGEELAVPGIYVRREFRREGLAEQLLAEGEHLARLRGYKRIFFAPVHGPVVRWFQTKHYRPVQTILVKEL